MNDDDDDDDDDDDGGGGNHDDDWRDNDVGMPASNFLPLKTKDFVLHTCADCLIKAHPKSE